MLLGFGPRLLYSFTPPAPPSGDPIQALAPLLHYDWTDASTVTVNGSNQITNTTNKGSSGATNDVSMFATGPELNAMAYANGHTCWDGSPQGGAAVTSIPLMAENDPSTFIAVFGGNSAAADGVFGTVGTQQLASSMLRDSSGANIRCQGNNFRELNQVHRADEMYIAIVRQDSTGIFFTLTQEGEYLVQQKLSLTNRTINKTAFGCQSPNNRRLRSQLFEYAGLDRRITDAEIETMIAGLAVKYNYDFKGFPFVAEAPRLWWSGSMNSLIQRNNGTAAISGYNTSTGLITLSSSSFTMPSGTPCTFVNGGSAPSEFTNAQTYYWRAVTSLTGYLMASPREVVDLTPIIASSTNSSDSLSMARVNRFEAYGFAQEQIALIGGNTKPSVSRPQQEGTISTPGRGVRYLAACSGDSNVSGVAITPAGQAQSTQQAITGDMTLITVVRPTMRNNNPNVGPVGQRVFTFQDGDGTAYVDIMGTGSGPTFDVRAFTFGAVGPTCADSYTADDKFHAIIYRYNTTTGLARLDVQRIEDNVTVSSAGTKASSGDSMSGGFKLQSRHDIADVFELITLARDLSNTEVNNAMTQICNYYNLTWNNL